MEKKNNKAIRDWDHIWSNLLNNINYRKECVVLRDFHVDNIFYLKKDTKI